VRVLVELPPVTAVMGVQVQRHLLQVTVVVDREVNNESRQ